MNPVLEAFRSKAPDGFEDFSDDELTLRIAQQYPELLPSYLKVPGFESDFVRLKTGPTESTQRTAPLVESDRDFALAPKSMRDLLSDFRQKRKEKGAFDQTIRIRKAKELSSQYEAALDGAGGNPERTARAQKWYQDQLKAIQIDPVADFEPFQPAAKALGQTTARAGKVTQAAVGDVAAGIMGSPGGGNLQAYAENPDIAVADLPIQKTLKQEGATGARLALGLTGAAPVIGVAAGLGAAGVGPELANVAAMGFDEKGKPDPVGMLAAVGLPMVDKFGRQIAANLIAKRLSKTKVILEQAAAGADPIVRAVVNRSPTLEKYAVQRALEFGGGQLANNAFLLAIQTPGILDSEDPSEALKEAIVSNLALGLLGAPEVFNRGRSLTGKTVEQRAARGEPVMEAEVVRTYEEGLEPSDTQNIQRPVEAVQQQRQEPGDIPVPPVSQEAREGSPILQAPEETVTTPTALPSETEPGDPGARVTNEERRAAEEAALTIPEATPPTPNNPNVLRPEEIRRRLQERSRSVPRPPEPAVPPPAPALPEGPMGPFAPIPQLAPPADTGPEIAQPIIDLIQSVHMVASSVGEPEQGVLYGALEAAPVAIRQLETQISKLEAIGAHDKAEPLYGILSDIDRFYNDYQGRPGVAPRGQETPAQREQRISELPKGRPERIRQQLQARSQSAPRPTKPSQIRSLLQQRSSTGRASIRRTLINLADEQRARNPRPSEIRAKLQARSQSAPVAPVPSPKLATGFEVAPGTAPDSQEAQVKAIIEANKGSARAALGAMYDAGLFTGLNKSIVEDLLKNGTVDVAIELATAPSTRYPGARGLYGDGMISVFQEAFAVEGGGAKTFLHEFLHALTLNLDPASPEYQTLTGIFVEAMEAAKLSGQKFYGLTNIDEFLSEAHSNPGFQEFLANTKTGGKQSLWNRLIDWIKKLLGIRNRGALAEVLKATKPIIARSKGAAKGKAYSLSQANSILKETRTTGSPEEIANATENVRKEQAAQSTSGLPDVRQSVADMEAIVAQRNRRGDVRITGPALQELRVVQATLANPVVQSHFVGPVLNLEESITDFGVASTTFEQLKADPDSSPQLISAAANEARKHLDKFYGDVLSFRRTFDSEQEKMQEKLDVALIKGQDNRSQSQAADALIDDFIKDAQAVARLERNSGAAKELDYISKNSSGARNALAFISEHVDLGPVRSGTITTIDELVKHIKVAAAPLIEPDKNLDQVLGANQDTLRPLSRFILRSQVIQQRIDEGKDFISGKAIAIPLSELKKQVAIEVKAGHINQALRLISTGIGRNAIEKARSRKAAQSFAHEERKLLVEMEAMKRARAMIDSVEQSPGFRARALEIYERTGVREKIISIEGEVIVLAPHYSTDQPVRLEGTGANGADKLKALSDWLKAGLAYAANTTHPEWDPGKVAAIQTVAHNKGLELDPAVNPLAGKFLESKPRAIMRFWTDIFPGGFSGWNKVPKYVTDLMAGLEAERAIRQQNAYSSAQELKQSIDRENHGKMGVAIVKAFRSHMMTQPDWKKKVFTYLAASLQSFNNPRRLKVGSVTPTGHEITQADMDYFQLNKSVEGDTIASMNGLGERELRSIQVVPRGVRYDRNGKVAFRLPMETGPGTVHRRLSSLVALTNQWNTAKTPKEKIDFLNKNLDQILIGYVADVLNPDFSFTYRFPAAFKAIALDPRNPITSFDDLVGRVYDHFIAEGPEGVEEVGPDQIAGEILSEVGDNFKKFLAFRGESKNQEKSIFKAWGGENSFNTERGRQIVPAAWYDYGITSEGEFTGFLHNSTAGFAIDYFYSLQLLLRQLNQEIELQKGKPPESWFKKVVGMSESQKLQREGLQIYHRGELVRLHDQLDRYVKSLETALSEQISNRGSTGDEGPGDLMGDFLRGTMKPQAFFNYTIQSLMTMPTTQNLNAVGGATQLALFNMIYRRKAMVARMATLGYGTGLVRTLFKEMLYVGGRTAETKAMAKLMGNARYVPLIGPITEAIYAHMVKAFQESQLASDSNLAKKLGLDLNMDLTNIASSEWDQFREGATVRTEDEAAYALEENFVGKALAGVSEIMRQFTMGHVDARLNTRVLPLLRELAEDLEQRAILYGGMREDRARKEGRDPFDITDLRNRFTDQELVGGRLENKQAHRLRDLWRRDGQANLDYELWQFYGRWVADGKPDPESMAPERRLLGDKGLYNQLAMAVAKDVNLATFDTRPIGSRMSKAAGVFFVFMGYTSWSSYKLTSIADRESRKTWTKDAADNIPTLISILTLLTIMGIYQQWDNDQIKKFILKRYTPFPNIFDKQSTSSRVKSALVGFGSMVPFFGSFFLQIADRAYKRGFDFNSSVLAINEGQDIINTFRETMQTGAIVRPWTKLSARYFFPVNHAGPRLPVISGLNEIAQARNLLTKGARSLDNVETIRTAVQRSSGTMDYAAHTPAVNSFINAVGNHNRLEARDAFADLLKMNKQKNSPDEALRLTEYQLQSRFPTKSVFRQTLTEQQYRDILGILSNGERAKLEDILGTYNEYLRDSGMKEVSPFGEPEKLVPKGREEPQPAGFQFQKLSDPSLGQGSMRNLAR